MQKSRKHFLYVSLVSYSRSQLTYVTKVGPSTPEPQDHLSLLVLGLCENPAPIRHHGGFTHPLNCMHVPIACMLVEGICAVASANGSAWSAAEEMWERSGQVGCKQVHFQGTHMHLSSVAFYNY